MGVAPGRTTVVATSESGAAIVEYDVNVGRRRGEDPGGRGDRAAGGASGRGGDLAGDCLGHSVGDRADGVGRHLGAGDAGGRTGRADGDGADSGGLAAGGGDCARVCRRQGGGNLGAAGPEQHPGQRAGADRGDRPDVDAAAWVQLAGDWANGWRFGLLTGAGAVANTTLNIPGTSGVPASIINPALPLGLSPFMNAPVPPNQIGAGFTSGRWDVNGIIDALAADQLVTILAEPNLTAQSGETGELPGGRRIPGADRRRAPAMASPTITVEFKQFGVEPGGGAYRAVAGAGLICGCARRSASCPQRGGQRADAGRRR